MKMFVRQFDSSADIFFPIGKIASYARIKPMFLNEFGQIVFFKTLMMCRIWENLWPTEKNLFQECLDPLITQILFDIKIVIRIFYYFLQSIRSNRNMSKTNKTQKKIVARKTWRNNARWKCWSTLNTINSICYSHSAQFGVSRIMSDIFAVRMR